jgi:hypothetical protein
MYVDIKPLEQDMIELAREGLAIRIRRANERKWRLQAAQARLVELEKLNARAIEKLGNPHQQKVDLMEMRARHHQELDELRDRQPR